MRAVKFSETECVAREVRWRPVEDHADAGLMALVDELHEICRGTIAARRSVVSDRLVSPRAVEWMLHDRQQLDVGVAEFLHVGNQLVGKFAVSQPAIALFGIAPPAAEVNLVDG